MVPGIQKTALRSLIENHLSLLSTDAEALITEQCDAARREVADQLNQAVRCLCIAPDAEEISATLLDAAAQFSSGAALFHIVHDAAKAQRVRGLSEPDAEAFLSLEIPLSAAAALAGAVETRDPVTAAATPREVSSEVCALFRHDAGARVFIFPVVVRNGVPALIYAWGVVQGSAIEMLTQVAGAIWSALPEPTPEPAVEAMVEAGAPSDLVSILPAPVKPAAPEPAMTWQTLSAEEQQVHLRAQRFARVQVAEMRLFESDAVQAGRTQRNIYESLRKSIDAAREAFRQRFFGTCNSMVDYLDLELTRTLANDDPNLLGKTYPGPLVQ